MAASMTVRLLRSASKYSSFCRPQLTRHARYVGRPFHTSRLLASLDDDFLAAKERLSTLSEDPGNVAKLKIYALFKQSTEGQCTKPKPGMMDFVGKAKWEAWTGLGDMTQDKAKQEYIETINELAGSAPAKTTEAPTPAAGPGKYTEIKVVVEDKMTKITLNRPAKKNAITFKMYDEIIEALNEAGDDPNTTVTVMTGSGDYYCSGNDLGNFSNIPEGGLKEMAKNGAQLLRRFVNAFIDHQKPLIGVINGPAVGVSVTVLGLFDAVYATDRATFHTPFSILGQSPEGTSSLTFPKIFGHSRACEMLLFNKKLTAHEALGLVTEVFPHDTFEKEVWERLRGYANLPPESLKFSKILIRDAERNLLKEVNDRECQVLMERWLSEEFMNAIMNFFTRKQK